MKIVVAGGSGFIGEPLVRALAPPGEVVVLSRNPAHVHVGRGVAWHPPSGGAWTDELRDADAVVNLAGENVGAGRWTAARKRRILESRLDATHALVDALKSAPPRPRVLISASAVGYYGIRDDEMLDEGATTGGGFLAEVTRQWEAVAIQAESVARVVILRFGMVVANDGGALARLLLPFTLGLGGPIGSGRQWMSWIDRDDVIGLIAWALDNPNARGVYNATAPHPVTNRAFSRALARVLRRPAILPAPAFALHLALGQMADEMVIGGQRVVPARATAEGYDFRFPEIEAALRHAVA